MPADGFAAFARGVWEAVRADRDLDLPTQREMLAVYRCDEIVAVSVAAFQKAVAPLRTAVRSDRELPAPGALAAALQDALDKYDATAHRYKKVVFERKRDALAARCGDELEMLFSDCVQLCVQMTLAELEETLAARLGTEVPPADFEAVAEELLAEALAAFEALDKAFRVPGLGDEWDIATQRAEMRSAAAKLVRTLRKEHLDRVRGVVVREWRSEHEPALVAALEAAGPGLWDTVREAVAAGTEASLNEWSLAAADARAVAQAVSTEVKGVVASRVAAAVDVVRTLCIPVGRCVLLLTLSLFRSLHR